MGPGELVSVPINHLNAFISTLSYGEFNFSYEITLVFPVKFKFVLFFLGTIRSAKVRF